MYRAESRIVPLEYYGASVNNYRVIVSLKVVLNSPSSNNSHISSEDSVVWIVGYK